MQITTSKYRSRVKNLLSVALRLVYFRFTTTLEGDIYTIKNPFALLKENGAIELTDGTTLQFNGNNKEDVFRLALFAVTQGIRFGESQNQWKLGFGNGTVETPQGLKFLIEGFDGQIFQETFLNEIHFVDFDLNGKTIVEAGAFTGDTALYYASKGAIIYSFEPDLRSFEIASKNILLNKQLPGRIFLNNYAIGKDGEVRFPISAVGSGGSTLYAASKSRLRLVKSISVGTILREYEIRDPFLLHLDAMGAEFEVISDDSLARFERIRIEYCPYLHIKIGDERASLSMILRRLEHLGFRHVRVFKHNQGRYDLRNHGTIDAKK